MTAQPCLPIVSAYPGCGYCEQTLTLQPRSDWACERCKPLLAAVRTEQDWILMHRKARRLRAGLQMHAPQLNFPTATERTRHAHRHRYDQHQQ